MEGSDEKEVELSFWREKLEGLIDGVKVVVVAIEVVGLSVLPLMLWFIV